MALIKISGAILNKITLLKPAIIAPCSCENLHTTTSNFANVPTSPGPKSWSKYNDKIYTPQGPDEPPRPAFVCHVRSNIKYSPWKMWYVACLIRGMAVDEAIKQLKFVNKKGAKHVREVLEEAKEIAVKEHNVEYPSNMWVAESFVGKGVVIKGLRRHARQRFGIIEYFHCHYFVRLEEGKPPENYYLPYPKKPQEQLEDWLNEMRKRKITNSL